MTGNGIAIIFGLLALSIGPSISRQVKNSKVDLPTIHIHPIEVEGKTFYMGTFFKANWFKAGEFCKIHGMELASVRNSRDNDALIRAINKHKISKSEEFWTSGNDLAKKESWKWSSTGASFIKKFAYWAYKEPDTESPNKHCIMLTGDESWRWKAQDCKLEKNFICEQKKVSSGNVVIDPNALNP